MILAAFLFVGDVGGLASAEEPPPIPGIGPAGKIVKLHGGFLSTEGPAWDGHGNLYFNDVGSNRLHKIDSDGKLSAVLDHSQHLSGLMFNSLGQLAACDREGQLRLIDVKTKEVTVLEEGYQGNRFNAPSDLVLDSAGGIYFSDPRFQDFLRLRQATEAIYYRSADGTVTRIIDDLTWPNGVVLSVDEKTLYAMPGLQKEMMSYAVESPGKLAKGKVFCVLEQGPESKIAGVGGDGVTIDSQGNLYIATSIGIQVFNSTGKHLGSIKFPEITSNATFGGKDLKTLYVTARTSVYAVEMEVKGHIFPGAKITP